MMRRSPSPDQLPLRLVECPDKDLERIIEAHVAARAEAEAVQWRFRLVVIESVMIASLVLVAGLMLEQPADLLLRGAALVGGCCFLTGVILIGLTGNRKSPARKTQEEKMRLDMLPHGGGNEYLTVVTRRPDESLHDYLVRCQLELGDRIRFLASVRDAQRTILGTERRHWRRRGLLLTFTGPAGAALTYASLGLCGAADSVPVLLMAGLIACAGLAGAPLAIGATRIIGRISDWLLTRRVRRWE